VELKHLQQSKLAYLQLAVQVFFEVSEQS